MGSSLILVLDDDPVFGAIVSQIAEQSQTRVLACRSESEALAAPLGSVVAAIVDFDLGTDRTGLDVIRELESRGLRAPVILVSGSRAIDEPLSEWPKSVRGFLEKSVGQFAIFEAAISAFDAETQHNVERVVRT